MTTAAAINLGNFSDMAKGMVESMKNVARELLSRPVEVLCQEMLKGVDKMLTSASRYEGSEDWTIVKLLERIREIVNAATTKPKATNTYDLYQELKSDLHQRPEILVNSRNNNNGPKNTL